MSYYASPVNYTPNSVMGQLFGTNPAQYGGAAANSPAAENQAIINQVQQSPLNQGLTNLGTTLHNDLQNFFNWVNRNDPTNQMFGGTGLLNELDTWDPTSPNPYNFNAAAGSIGTWGKWLVIGGVIVAAIALSPSINNLSARHR